MPKPNLLIKIYKELQQGPLTRNGLSGTYFAMTRGLWACQTPPPPQQGPRVNPDEELKRLSFDTGLIVSLN